MLYSKGGHNMAYARHWCGLHKIGLPLIMFGKNGKKKIFYFINTILYNSIIFIVV
jgi:hypothetical protein